MCAMKNTRRQTRHRMTAFVLSAALCATSLVPGSALAAQRSAAGEAGLGLLSVFTTLVYGTVKITYAALGALTGGAAYVLSGGNPDLSRVLLERSLRGDYVVTPEMLTGERSLVFVGRDPVNDPTASGASSGDAPLEAEPDQSEPYPY
jgi:hypothetical protein